MRFGRSCARTCPRLSVASWRVTWTRAARKNRKRSLPMSSLEMFALLELGQGRPLVHGQEHDQAASRWEAFHPLIRKLIAFGKRSLLMLALLALWEVIPRLGLIDPAFLPPF